MSSSCWAPAWGSIVSCFLALSASGQSFFAISDDDYSRLVIAQQFAELPKVDPSGTSWLPLPFWLYGSAFALFGNTLSVAQVVATLTGLLAVAGIYVAARWVSLTIPAALLAAVIGALFPHAANYRMATVPDYPTAVLALLGATSLAARSPHHRFLGAVAALTATLSRYETWPLALTVALFAIIDWHKDRSNRWLLTAAAAAPAGVAAWVLHGLVRHSDAFFFVKRVTAYKRALGGTAPSFTTRLTAEPLAFLREEPELVVTTVALGIAVALFVGRRAFVGAAWQRPTMALFSVLAFLVAGNLRDSTPTHHGERVLLSLWLGLALLIAAFLALFIGQFKSLAARGAALGLTILSLGLLVAATAQFVRPRVVTVEPFVDRSRELAVGASLRSLLPAGETVAVYTEDYGYFAVDAALGRPFAVTPLLRRDPRHPEPDPLLYPKLLRPRLDAIGARYFVVPAAHRPTAEALALRLASVSGFEVYRRN